MAKNGRENTVATNRQAYHEYFVIETHEAGIELCGTEVKSIRQGGVNLKDAYCTVTNGELLVRGLRISPYEKGNIFNKDPLRTRRLLMQLELVFFSGHAPASPLSEDSLTIIPLFDKTGKGMRVKYCLSACRP